jgi:hypothetical protein
MRRVALLLAAAGAVALVSPSLATATTRFAAPGGTAPDTMCTTPATPCSIGTAAGGSDVTAADEAVIQPGDYTDADLDGDADQPMDHTVQVRAGSVHGEVGDRPVIRLVGDVVGAFVVGANSTLSDVEVNAPNSAGAISQTGGVVERVIARTGRGGSAPCLIEPSTAAILRDSVCLTDGGDSEALRSGFIGEVGTHTVLLRNVTAMATKPDSDGLVLATRGHGVNLNVDAKSVIARGGANDVIAFALSNFDPPLPNTGGNTTVTLDHSDYVTWSARSDTGGGMAAVTPAGTGTNQTGAVVLAADDYHQVAGSGSEILDHGAVDAFSGGIDIDGQNRTIRQAPDIGADELGFQTSTALSCMPNVLQLGMGSTRCAVTVTDASSPPPVSFGSGIRFASDGPGAFGSDCEVLNPSSATQGTCTQPFTPAAPGIRRITATFPGDSIHDPSQASQAIDVMAPPAVPIGPSPARHARCHKKKHRASASKKRKCRRKRRR